jgi:hypothetical protein
MNDHPSKMPNEKRKNRFTSMRPQLEQLDPRICFSIDLPEPFAAFPAIEMTAEVSTYIEINSELHHELEADSNNIHGAELVFDTDTVDSEHQSSIVDLFDDSIPESNVEKDKGATELTEEFITSTFPEPTEVGRMNVGEAMPDPSINSEHMAGSLEESPLEYWGELQFTQNSTANESLQTTSPLPSPFPSPLPHPLPTPSANKDTLPLVQPVTVIPLQSRSTSNEVVMRRDIADFIGTQSDVVRQETQPPQKLKRNADSNSLPLVMNVSPIAFERASTTEKGDSETWIVTAANTAVLQQVPQVELVSMGSLPTLQNAQPTAHSPAPLLPVELGVASVVGMYAAIDSGKSPADSDIQETSLSENTYRLLLAGLIAIPTSTRGKKVLRWFQRDKKRDA